ACIGRLVETNRSSRSTASWCCGPGCARHHRIDGIRRAHRDTEIRFDHPCWKSIRELLPRGAAVSRLEDSPFRTAELRAFDVTLLLLPECSVNDVRILRIDANVVAAHVLVLVKHLLESLAAISRAEYSALGIWTVGMAKCSNEEPVRIRGIDLDVRNHLRLAETQMRPRLASVGRLVHAIADREIRPNDSGASSYIDDVRIRRRDSYCADRSRWFVIEQRDPVRAVICGPPDTAVVVSDIEDIRLAGHPRERPGAPRARRPDLPPVHLGVEGIGGLRGGDGTGDRCERRQTNGGDGDHTRNGHSKCAF